MKKYIKTIAAASLYTFLAVAGIYASETGKRSQEDGIVYFTSSEKDKLKAVFDADTQERTAKLQQAKELLKKLVDVEKRKPDDKQVRAMNTNIANMEKRIATNTKLTDDMIKTGKYSYGSVVKQLEILGKTPQDVLQAPGIRGKFFAGEKFAKEAVEDCLLKIDAINSNKPKEDLEQAFRKYKNSSKNLTNVQKVDFICEIINNLNYQYKYQSLMTDAESNLILKTFRDSFAKNLLTDAVNILDQWLTSFEKDSKLSANGKVKQKLFDANAMMSNLKKEAKL